MRLYQKLLFTILLIYMPISVLATPCDCSVKLGQCNAFPSEENGEPIIRSTTNQCSFVTYRLNGNPSSVTVVDGTESLRYLGNDMPSIAVDSCDICRDSRFESSNSNVGSQPISEENPLAGEKVNDDHGGGYTMVGEYNDAGEFTGVTTVPGQGECHWKDGEIIRCSNDP